MRKLSASQKNLMPLRFPNPETNGMSEEEKQRQFEAKKLRRKAVEMRRKQKQIMENLEEAMKEATKFAADRILQTQSDRALLRSMILEEAEKQGEQIKVKILEALDSDGYGSEEDGEKLRYIFERDLRSLIDDFYKKNVCESNIAVHRAMIALGEDSRRHIEARLIEERKDELREALKDEFWTFSNLVLLGDRDIQKVLREVDAGTLAKALKLAEFNIQDKIFRNMSKKAATMLKEDMEYMGPIRKKDVYEAQDEIISIMDRLEEKGEIVIARNEGDELG